MNKVQKIKFMEKKKIPFSGKDDATKQPHGVITDWDSVKSFDEWKGVDLDKVDLRSFNWLLATHDDVSQDVLLNLLQRLVLNTTKRVKHDGFRFKFNGHEIMCAKNVMNITGQKKNGKSQWLNILASIALKKSPVHKFGDSSSFGCVECMTPVDRILWIDTEQGATSMEYNYMRLFNLMGLDVHEWDEKLPNAMDYGLMFVPLRPFGTENRKIITDLLIRVFDPDIVIIDGIRDLVHDINNHDEATDVVNWTLRIADERDVWCVIHQNPTGTGDKMRGAIGTELANKCDTTFQVTKAQGMFAVNVPEDGCRHDAGDKKVMFRYESRVSLQCVECIDVVRKCFNKCADTDGAMTWDKLHSMIKDITGAGDFDAGDTISMGIADGWLIDVTHEHKSTKKQYFKFIDRGAQYGHE